MQVTLKSKSLLVSTASKLKASLGSIAPSLLDLTHGAVSAVNRVSFTTMKYLTWSVLIGFVYLIIMTFTLNPMFNQETYPVLFIVHILIISFCFPVGGVLWFLGCKKSWPKSKTLFVFCLFYFPIGIYYAHKLENEEAFRVGSDDT